MSQALTASTKGDIVTIQMADRRKPLPFEDFRIEGTAVIGVKGGIAETIGTCRKGAKIIEFGTKSLIIKNSNQ